MPVPNNRDQAEAFARGQRRATVLWVAPDELAGNEDEIERYYIEAEREEPWDLRGWFSNGFEQRWDRLTATHERSNA